MAFKRVKLGLSVCCGGRSGRAQAMEPAIVLLRTGSLEEVWGGGIWCIEDVEDDGRGRDAAHALHGRPSNLSYNDL